MPYLCIIYKKQDILQQIGKLLTPYKVLYFKLKKLTQKENRILERNRQDART